MELFYQRLKRLRVEKGFKVKDIAEKIQVSVSTYREWEYGRSIKGEPYAKLAEVLGVTIEELLTGKTSTPQEVMQSLEDCKKCMLELEKKLQSFF